MACVDARPDAQRVLRRAWRMANRLQADLLAVFVETPGWANSSPEDRQVLEENLRFAEDLGDHTSVVDPSGGMLAINTDCPSSPAPVGGIAEFPDVAQPAASQSDTPPRRYILLGALAVLAVIAASAGAWYAQRGAAR